MFMLRISDPDALGDPEPQDSITLGRKADVDRAFMTLTDMYVNGKRSGIRKKENWYGILNEGKPYPDLLMLPPYRMAGVALLPDEFRMIQDQAQAFLAQEHPRDDGVRDVLKTLIDAKLPALVGRSKGCEH
jgi:hypothetical protein